jgi:nitric oxide reductase subunit C
MARNIFYGGTAFFVLLFAVWSSTPSNASPSAPTPSRPKSRRPWCAASTIWETRNCIGCHTLLGEGAYFAPELGNVYTPWRP